VYVPVRQALHGAVAFPSELLTHELEKGGVGQFPLPLKMWSIWISAPEKEHDKAASLPKTKFLMFLLLFVFKHSL
jgi:hypothetical protein